MQEVKCHNAIAEDSLYYLMQFQEPLSEERLKASALARYSAQFWSSHLRKTADGVETTRQLAIMLFSVENPVYLNGSGYVIQTALGVSRT
jgi:hypothetical protein